MKNLNIIIGIGILVLLLPILGLPQSIDNVLYFLSGVAVSGLAFSIKLKDRQTAPRRKTSTFEENGIYGTEEKLVKDTEDFDARSPEEN